VSRTDFVGCERSSENWSVLEAYRPPEMFQDGNEDTKTVDVYSFGLILYELVMKVRNQFSRGENN
jgi:serine/threonine protein kinase